MDNPFDIQIYDRNWQHTGSVVDPTFINLVPGWRDQGYGNFMVTAANPHAAALQEPGARIVVQYRGQNILSGPIRSRQGDVFGYGGVTYQVLDWTQFLLRNTLGWVNSGRPLEPTSLTDTGATAWLVDPGAAEAGTTKGQYGYIHWPDGSAVHSGYDITSAEQALKYMVTKNLVNRMGLPVTVAPNQGRGGDPSDYLPKTRWVALSEVFTPILDQSGLGVRIWHDGVTPGLQFDVIDPDLWPQEIRYDSGIITAGTYTISGPDATRIIAGGPSGTDAAGRLVYGDQGNYPLNGQEALWGIALENFIDATGYDLDWPDNTPESHKEAKYFKYVGAQAEIDGLYKYLRNQVRTTRTDASDSNGLALKLTETSVFHWGGDDGVQNGDWINVRLSDDTLIADQVTSAQLVFNRDDGFTCTPIVGDYSDDQDHELAVSVARIERHLRRMAAFR